MAANKRFTPRASTNLIEEEVATPPVTTPEEEETTPVVNTPVEEDTVTAPDVEEETTSTATEEDTKAPEEAPKVDEKAEEVTFTAQTDSKPIEKRVKICLAKKYDGCIGGIWYHFEKNQVVTVPENVKRILNKTEGMLKPL